MERDLEIVCQRCGSHQIKLTIAGPHYKASCKECGRYIKFVSKALVDPKDVEDEKDN